MLARFNVRMRRFLKIFIGIVFLWALTWPWTFSYLSTIARLSTSGDDSLFRPVVRDVHVGNDNIVVGIVACGKQSLDDTIVLLKSIILSSEYHRIPSMDFVLFSLNEHLTELDSKVRKLQSKRLKFRYEIHPVIFPVKNQDEWKMLYKPCSTQRLFLHTTLPHISEILYLDVDTLVVGDLREVWSRFRQMSSEQVMGIVAEHEIDSVGWYNKFAKHPYYPPLGLNTGVMLMNLTRLRMKSALNWDKVVVESYKKYKDKLVWGDQDVINIVFHERPDAVYLLPCTFNYRTDHCTQGQNCKAAEGKGIFILHGNKGAFHNSTSSIFAKMYKLFKEFDMNNDYYVRDVVGPIKKHVELTSVGSSDRVKTSCDDIGNFIFNFYTMQKY